MQIDSLRKERRVFKKINIKLQKELTQQKEELKKELKEAEDCYLKKDSIRKKLNELKKDATHEDIYYQEELRKLRDLIEGDKKNGIYEKVDNRDACIMRI